MYCGVLGKGLSGRRSSRPLPLARSLRGVWSGFPAAYFSVTLYVMDNPEDHRHGSLSAPLWAMAIALWVIAIVGIVGAVKMFQIQAGIQHEIEQIPKIKLPKF